ncbi:hypothetical protein H5407_03200 [Mitsuaria sp. WAJ17]|uniref:hypothetical protein n=1 Tax=Mitsuaria sp. WAJ17 TaxID=2761452 RepID=UPI0016019D75|nr:hypothetical protein [Mitsuaria sp. WAJ17]MBB2484227.1 hypothetical protein [Mitsuaria sp. WAJ17]
MALLICAGAAQAQVISPAVSTAVTVDAVFQAIGGKPASSGYLVIDAPDVMEAGKTQVRVRSEISGTGWLVLLKGRKGKPAAKPAAPGQPVPPVFIKAVPFKGGEVAQTSMEVELTHDTYLTLVAYSRGRWYYAERELKIAVPALSSPRAQAFSASSSALPSMPASAAASAAAKVLPVR